MIWRLWIAALAAFALQACSSAEPLRVIRAEPVFGKFGPVVDQPVIVENQTRSLQLELGFCLTNRQLCGPDNRIDYAELFRAYDAGQVSDDQMEYIFRNFDVATAAIELEPAAGASDDEFPLLLPWPPPEASKRLTLDRALILNELGPEPSLQAVADLISDELRARDYERIGFLGVPGNGFALLTGLEQIDRDARPLEGSSRWIETIVTDREFSLASFFDALFFAPEGNFRVLVFVVTNLPFNESRERRISTEDLEDWSVRAVSSIPSSVGEVRFGPRHEVNVLVYEFVKRSNAGEAELRTPGLWTVREHLAFSGLSRFATGAQ